MGLIVSSGGHVYDRTTGTWEGATQGSVGDGIDRSVSDRAGLVIHDANGAVGVRYDNPGTPSAAVSHGGGGSGSGSAVVTTSGTTSNPVQGAGGSGPGSQGVANSAVPLPGGRGAGSSMIVMTPKSPGPNTPLQQDLTPTVTKVRPGGDWWHSNPWFSDADAWTKRYGESELAETLFFVTNVSADLGFNVGYRGAELFYHVADSPFMTNAPARINGGAPKHVDAWGRPTFQEPVDWGR